MIRAKAGEALKEIRPSFDGRRANSQTAHECLPFLKESLVLRTESLRVQAVRRPRVSYKRELFSRIDLIVCEILACESSDPDRAHQLLAILYNLHLWRGGPGISRQLGEGLQHLALMTAIPPSPVAERLAKMLWELCWGFAGPHYVPLPAEGVALIRRSIDSLDTMILFNSEHGRSQKLQAVIAAQLANFFEQASWYSRPLLADQVLRAYATGLKGCRSDVSFTAGTEVLKKSLGKLGKLLAVDKPGWRKQQAQITSLLRDTL